MRGEAHHVTRLEQTHMQNSGVTGPKFTKFLSDVKGSLAVLTHSSTLQFSHPSWNAAHRMKVRYANFRRFAPKSINITTFLEQSRKEGRTDHTHSYVYLS